jgi:hypothetical protein
MAVRPQFSHGDKGSLVPGVAGAASAAEFCTQAFPESSNKRQWFNMAPLLGPTQGATPTEVFIDGVQGFRFRVPNSGVSILKIQATYFPPNAPANATAFEYAFAATNVNGVITVLANGVFNKMPTASTAALAVTADSPTQSLVVTATGVAGDVNGRWDIRCTGISEVTDIG